MPVYYILSIAKSISCALMLLVTAEVIMYNCRRTGHYVRSFQSFDRCRVVERDSTMLRQRQPTRRRQLRPLASLRL